MRIPDLLFSDGWLWFCWLAWSALLGWALLHCPWARLRDPQQQHVFLGATVSLLLLWSCSAGIRPGLGFHFLGLTIFTLMFGWSLALIGSAIASIGSAVAAGVGYSTLALDALLLAVLPVLVAHLVQQEVQRRLPANVFIYIFLCGFFGAMVTAGLTVLALVSVLWLGEAYSFRLIADEYLPFLPLYLLPEGLLNGMLTAVFVGLRPHWLATFDDKRYWK